ncbi:hypothetical protein C5L23_001334 [Leuconostoc fallax]|uniref:Uncharacterized protein n=1 Tax=Leuconostoc fallax TaxID=1251 RepID=A0A4R5N6V6_9LACO|nr:hypothetical protein C5L23_001334 [Leuconostoc fallax]
MYSTEIKENNNKKLINIYKESDLAIPIDFPKDMVNLWLEKSKHIK